jgi:hypothetical protein
MMVIIESRYALAAVAHSLSLGESPFASHVLYTDALNDRKDIDRVKGMEAGWALYPKADLVAVYWDLGISKGMVDGIERAARAGCTITYRKIGWPESLIAQIFQSSLPPTPGGSTMP